MLQLHDTTVIIHRTTGFVPGSSDYTCCFWIMPNYPNIDPDYMTAFALINADYSEWVGIWTGVTPYVWGLGTTSDGHGNVNIGTYYVWNHFAYVRTGTTHQMFRNGVAVPTVNTADLSTLAFAELMLGYDGFSVVPRPMRFSNWREWNVALTEAQIAAEMASRTTAVHAANLFTDTPLTPTTQLSDVSGHGHHWVGSGSYRSCTTWTIQPDSIRRQ